jgi:hypothetical protein
MNANEGETFTIIAKPNGLFLKEDAWPEFVQFTQQFLESCDDRFVRFTQRPWTIEIKLENASATYKLAKNPFFSYNSLIDGHLIAGKVLSRESYAF